MFCKNQYFCNFNIFSCCFHLILHCKNWETSAPRPPGFDATELELCYSCVTLCVKSIEASKWKGHYDNLALFWLFFMKIFWHFLSFFFYCLALYIRRHLPTLVISANFFTEDHFLIFGKFRLRFRHGFVRRKGLHVSFHGCFNVKFLRQFDRFKIIFQPQLPAIFNCDKISAKKRLFDVI